MTDDVAIRPAVTGDGEALARIYNGYIRDSIVTFEEVEVSGAEMARRLAEVDAASLPWLVADGGGDVVGYAYATRWKQRIGYRFSVEVTVYLDPAHMGRGLGARLYGALLPLLEARGVHAAIGGIALPNDASIALHERFGFEKVAQFREVGTKFGRWIDVGYWEKVFR